MLKKKMTTKGDPQLIRWLNRRLVIDALRRYGPLSRTDLGQLLGLEPSTITSIIQELLAEGLVREVGQGESRGGRRPILLDLNYDYGHTLGAKIEVERVRVGLVSLDGRLLAEVEERYERGSSPKRVLNALLKAIEQLPNVPRLLGLGVGVSGFVHSERDHLMYSPILGWQEVDLASPLRERLALPVFITNDVTAFTLGEKWYGAGRRFRNFLLVTVGEGIGAGLSLEGHLYEGTIGGAGELGHTCIQIDGPLCRCGERGCLEALASDAFLRREGPRHGLPAEPEAIVRVAQEGNPEARELLAQMGRHLGIGLKNAVNLLNPEAIVIGGERLDAFEFFRTAMEEEVLKHSFPAEAESLEIVPAELGEAGWLIGAGTLPIRARFRPPATERLSHTESLRSS